MTIKTLFLGTLAGVSLLSFTTTAFAQEPGAPGKGAKRAGRAQAAGKRGQGGAGLGQLDAGLRAANLTPEQLAEIKTLALKFRDDIFAKLTPEQQEKVKAAMVAGPGADRPGAAAGARQGRNPFAAMLGQLDLTAEQKGKIEPIVAEAGKKLADTMRDARQGGKGGAKDARQAMQNIISDTKGQIRPLLTPEQQTKLDAFQATRAAGQGKARKGRGAGGITPPPAGGAFGSGG